MSLAQRLDLVWMKERLAVCQLPVGAALPAPRGSWWSMTCTATECSVVCVEGDQPAGARCEAGWRALCVRGPLSFDQVGVLAALALPLAAAGIPIFVISTFDTDYLLVKQAHAALAESVLNSAGHSVRAASENASL